MIYNFSQIKQQNDKIEQEMNGLKEKYHQQHMSEEQLERLQEKMKEAKKAEQKSRTFKKWGGRWIAAMTAALGVFVLLPNTSAAMANVMEQIPFIGQFVEVVTFRDYHYESERQSASIEVPELKVDNRVQTLSTETNRKLRKTIEEINGEIQVIADDLVKEFEANLEEEFYQDVVVTSEVLITTPEYFTLKLICYQGAGSGYQWNYYYTIDLNTGKQLQLNDIFLENSDYIERISQNIKDQMTERMAADSSKIYWLDSEVEAWNFQTITEETNFYLNEDGNVVIGFDEGEVAPMSMGTVEFVIPAELLNDIRN